MINSRSTLSAPLLAALLLGSCISTAIAGPPPAFERMVAGDYRAIAKCAYRSVKDDHPELDLRVESMTGVDQVGWYAKPAGQHLGVPPLWTVSFLDERTSTLVRVRIQPEAPRPAFHAESVFHAVEFCSKSLFKRKK